MYLRLMFLLCVLQAFVSCSKETDLPSVEDECIFVSGVGLQIQALDKNVNLYTDRSAYFSEVCSDLSGYSFISYNAGGTKGGLYKSNKNTYISVLAPLGCLDSPWSLSEQDCAFYYDNGIRNPLSKYIRKISSNVDYELPLSSSGEPVFIIGKNIEYVDRTSEDFPFVTGTMVRDMIKFGDKRWKDFIHPENYQLIEDHFYKRKAII